MELSCIMKMADLIKNLPTSQDPPSDIDVTAMRDVFDKSSTIAKSLQLKKIIIPVVIFIALSLPMVNKFIGTLVPDSESALI
ncbi:MAG: hypothetical protein E4H07_10080, partial [Nitrosomonadales bacterium]